MQIIAEIDGLKLSFIIKDKSNVFLEIPCFTNTNMNGSPLVDFRNIEKVYIFIRDHICPLICKGMTYNLLKNITNNTPLIKFIDTLYLKRVDVYQSTVKSIDGHLVIIIKTVFSAHSYAAITLLTEIINVSESENCIFEIKTSIDCRNTNTLIGIDSIYEIQENLNAYLLSLINWKSEV